MDRRQKLQELLESIIGPRDDGEDNVYFQPPEREEINYPCIMYERSTRKTTHASDKPYTHQIGYMLKVIDEDPDSPIVDKIAALPSCAYDRQYTSDNLHHDVFVIYF